MPTLATPREIMHIHTDRSSAKPSRRRLLVVDDEPGPRQSLQLIFKDDYEVYLADSGPSAMELLRDVEVDAAVLDIRMAGMSGVELLNRIKEHDPSIEAIMLTAYETLDTARQALRLGACDYITKPFELSAMRAAVAHAMERRAMSEEMHLNNLRLHELQEEIHSRRMREEILRAKGEMYASIIHDINGPLTIISGFIEIINQRLRNVAQVEGEDLEIVKDRLNRICRQVNNCFEISRRYLSLIRKQPSAAVEVRFQQILRDLEELLHMHPAASNQRLIIQPFTERISAACNSTDVIQILLNLSINALQAVETPHTVEISARVLGDALDLDAFDTSTVQPVLNRQGFANRPPLIAVEVKDDGPGIPPGIMSRIFDPYFTTKPSPKGTGLGLSIVHRLVKEANALLRLHSEPDHGACFTVYFPAQRP